MGLFSGGSKTKFYRDPESLKGGTWLTQFMDSWGPAGLSPNYPLMQVAGMTDTEQDVQNQLQGVARNGTEGYNLAMDQVRNTLQGQYDPRTSDLYRGFREEAQALKGQSNADIRRQAQKAGSLRSTPTASIQAENSRNYDSKMLQLLGQMYENERSRMQQAGQQAQTLGTDQVNTMIGTQALASVPRQIERQRYQAIYDKALQELLHPYQVQAQIAMGMYQSSPGQMYTQPGTRGELNKLNEFAGTMANVGLFGGIPTALTGSQPASGPYGARGF